MYKVIIIDDEPLGAMVVKEYLNSHNDFSVIQECSNGFEGVKAIMQHAPDLVFLDVQMPKLNGFEMLELLENPPAVIFTTAYDEYALKAFESHAVDYLLKPFNKERFDKALLKWKQQVKLNPQTTKNISELTLSTREEQNRIAIRNGSSIKIIPVNEVIYLEAYDDYVKIHTKDGMTLKKKTLQHFENTLPSSEFMRVHRSFIVQLSHISRIEPLTKDTHIAITRNGARIPLSKSGYSKLKETLGI